MRQVTLTLPDKMYEQLESLAHAEQRTPEDLAYERLQREIGEGPIDSRHAKELAKEFVQRRAGKCLAVRNPVLETGSDQVWLVPVVTNVVPALAAIVGEVMVNARTGEILTEVEDVVAMFKRGHPSLGFQSMPVEKQQRMSELMDKNNEREISDAEREELKSLVDESLNLDVRNLEQLEHRLVVDD